MARNTQGQYIPPRPDPGDGPPPVITGTVNPTPPVVVTAPQPNPVIMEKVARSSRELLLEAATIGQAEPYAFGTCVCKPLVIAADDSADTLVLDLLWSVGEVETVCLGLVHAHDLWGPDIGYLNVSGSDCEHFTGTAGQSASTIMTTLKGSYDALPNKAHSVISMVDGWNLNLTAWVQGVKVGDPRTGSPATKAYSANPALILADIFSRSGYTCDDTSVAEAADYADVGVDAFASPLSARWLVRGQITDQQELRHWVHALAQYAGCYIDIRGGTVIFVIDKPRSANHTVVTADIVAGSARLNMRSTRDTPSLVRVNSRSPGGSTWSVTYGTSGGPGTESTVTMPYWKNIHCNSRKAKEIHAKAQHAIESLEFIGWDNGLVRTLGDVGTVTYAPLGLSAVDMALVENTPVKRGRWRRKYVPYAAADYTDDSSGTDSGSATEIVNNPYFPPAGPAPVLNLDVVTTDSPNWTRIQINFSPQTWAYLKDYKVTVTTTLDEETILYTGYVDKGSETGSPETITTYTDFPTDFSTSPENVYRVNVYLRSIVSDGLTDVVGTPGTADIPVNLDVQATTPTITITANAATVITPTPITEGLMAWWTFDESGSNSRLNSHTAESPTKYHWDVYEYLQGASPSEYPGGSIGTSAGVVAVSPNSAVDPDNMTPAWSSTTSACLKTFFDSADALATCTSFTVAGWVKFDRLDQWQAIIRKGKSNAYFGVTTFEDWGLYVYTSGGSPAAASVIQLRAAGKTASTTELLTVGTWYFVAATFSDGEPLEISINAGTAHASATPTSSLTHHNTQMTLGFYTTPGWWAGYLAYYLSGSMDQWGIWSRKLSATDITNLYNAGSGVTYADLTWSS